VRKVKASDPGQQDFHSTGLMWAHPGLSKESMTHRKWCFVLALTSAIALPLFAGHKQMLNVVIIERENSEASYSAVIPGSSTSTTTGNANCYGYGNSASCSGNSTTRSANTPSRRVGYEVKGATLTLLLPDKRVAVVNCESKYAPKGDYVNRRSCRIPLVNEIEAEFSGDKAKLIWPVSVDGQKMESETYKVLGVFSADK
jgi:hypothetical protein